MAIEKIGGYLMPAIHTHKTKHGVWAKGNEEKATEEVSQERNQAFEDAIRELQEGANANGDDGTRSEASESGNDATDGTGTSSEDR